MVNMEKIKTTVDQDFDLLCEHCFSRWSNSLNATYTGLNLEENIEAMFYLMRRLLTEGRVKFCHPDDLLGKAGLVWTASIDEQIAYLRAGLPASITGQDNLEFLYYFYEYVPAILWKGADGKWYGS